MGHGACRICFVDASLGLWWIQSLWFRYNVSAETFEANSIAHEQPAEVARLAAILEKWVTTLDPIPPNTMGSRSKHAGCAAYAFPSGNPGGGASDAAADDAAALHRAAAQEPYLV